MTRRALSACVWIGAAALLVAGCTSEDGGERSDERARLRALLARADELGARGLEIEAVKALKQGARSLGPAARAEAHERIALGYHREEVFHLALQYAERARAAGRPGADLLWILGDSQRALEAVDEAERTLREALRREPDHHRARLALARTLLRKGDAVAALPLFEAYFDGARDDESERNDRQDRSARLEHGRALRAAGEHQRSADRFFELLEEQPLDPVCYSELARSLYRMRQREAARAVEEIYRIVSQQAFEEHVEDKLMAVGNTVFSLSQRAINLSSRRRFLEAYSAYRKALELDPADPRPWISFAEFCIRFRRLAEARTTLDRALDRGVRPASGLWWMRCRVDVELGDERGMLDAAKRGVEALQSEAATAGSEEGRAPPFSLYLHLARGALETGALDLADQALRAADGSRPGRWETSYWRGRLALARDDVGAALSSFHDAGRRRDGDVDLDLLRWTAEALTRAGRPDDAARLLEACLARDPAHHGAAELAGRLASAGAAGLADVDLRFAGTFLEKRRALEDALQSRPLEECGSTYAGLGALWLEARRPAGYDFLFLAADLDPENEEALERLLDGIRSPQDAFVRLHYVRRLHALRPHDPALVAEIVATSIRFHAGFDEASRIAGALHENGATPQSYRLLADIALARGKRDRALELIEEGVTRFPDDAGLRAARNAVSEDDS